MCQTLFRFLLALVLLPCLPANAGAPVFWLGGGGAPCNFETLATALGAVPQNAIIRIASNQPYDNINLDVDDLAVTLEGGWADCAGTPSAQRTVLNGAPGANLPVLRVEAAGIARSVRLEHLHIRGGTRSGLEVAGLVDVRLADTVVSASTGSQGGGIRVTGLSPQQTILRLVQSIVGSPEPGLEPGNVASAVGGGVYCSGGRVQLSGALVRGNQSDNVGGGLALSNCLLDLGGSILDVPGFGPLIALITGNDAQFFGGGIYAAQGSDLSLHTGNARILVHDNVASRGGGVYLTDAGTQLEGAGVVISSNAAATFGGGAFIQNDAVLALERGGSGDTFCTEGEVCSRIIDNEVLPASTTAASAVQVSGGTLLLRQTQVSGNSSSNPAQATIIVSGGGNATLEHSLLHGNDSGPGRLFRLNGLANALTLRASTIAGNTVASPLVFFGGSAGSAELSMDRGIVWQPGTVVHNAAVGDAVTSVCMNAHENTSINAVTHDPGFVDAANGDYRLYADSDNIDACTDGFGGDGFDLAGAARPIALGGVATPFDRGPYELTDVLFADDFELPKL